MSKKGMLTVISGFSGVGKGTVVKKLIEKYEYSLSISATTRNPRDGEEHGREYFFLTKSEFESMIENEGLFEWAEYVGNYYGTPKSYIMDQLELGNNVILEIELMGALQVKEKYPEALLLFIVPPSIKELKKRLVERGTEQLDIIEKRLLRASEEIDEVEKYDYVIVNNDVESCADAINQIINNEKSKTVRSREFMNTLKNQLNAYKEGE